jgi:hypothetical protein
VQAVHKHTDLAIPEGVVGGSHVRWQQKWLQISQRIDFFSCVCAPALNAFTEVSKSENSDQGQIIKSKA